jgi:integrase/recombinase XerD
VTARVYRDTYRDRRSGERVKAKRWTIEFRDHRGRARRLVAFTDRTASAALGHSLQRLAAFRAAKAVPDLALSREIEEWPERIRSRLAKLGLLELRQLAGSRPITDLLEEYAATLRARKRTEKHVAQTIGRARRVFAGAGATFPGEIDPMAVERFLAAERKRLGRFGATASNHSLAAAKAFCQWMLESRHASENPLRGLKPLNARLDRRRQRRAPTLEELRKLLEAALAGPERFEVDGATRYWIYRLASETGLRANEIRTLRAASFDLRDPGRAAVRVDAAYSKRRREDVIQLREATARELARFLAGRLPAVRPFPVPERSADMLREDLEAAEVDYQDEEDRFFDFHALRHGFVSSLAEAGVEPKVAQALARHSTITLTLDRYTHLRAGDERRALEKLPDLGAAGALEQSATGTDGDTCSASCSASPEHSQGATMRRVETETPAREAADAVLGSGGGIRTPDTRIMIPLL